MWLPVMSMLFVFLCTTLFPIPFWGDLKMNVARRAGTQALPLRK
ncbi:hypothetical protein Pan241w_36980 [Gimesia alba]|uniref:Uncharacterized protein n=1 Tax=Gimesia alba TaxID=2527973 RepID=A0A517RIA7_9PLAN|nr:hypothetical protein Pan241w_36980 [Gimesia alba]